MRGLHFFKKEIMAILKNRKVLIPVIAVMMIPILYSGMFLYAFWDPYQKLDELPVAVVNQDEGANFAGKPVNVGTELVDNLKKNPNFKWEFVTHDEATQGLKNRNYYMMIELPKDFSQKATTVLNKQPEKMDILYVPNESYNFLSAQIGSTAMEKVKTALSQNMTQEYVKVMKENLIKLAKGSDQLTQGMDQLNSGTSLLLDGLQVKTSDVKLLADGANQILLGLQQLQNHVPQLVNGTNQLNEGATNIAGKMGDLARGTAKLKSGTDSLSQNLNTLSPQLIQAVQTNLLIPPEQRLQLIDAINKVNAGSQNVSLNAGQVASGAARISEGANQLAAGASKLNKSVQALPSGVDQLVNGQTKVANGTQTLVQGWNTTVSGVASLNQGANQATDGSHVLNNGLNQAANLSPETQNMFSDPVGLKTERYTPVPNYGTGFAPYFLSLGLYVGALLLSIVLSLRTPVTVPKSAFSWFMGKFGILVVVGVIQAVIADVILLGIMKLQVQSISGFVFVSVMIALTFVTLIQFLVTAFDHPGRFVAIVILILQLTTSAGTFPLELIPNALQVFNSWLPMTYSVAALKATISSGDYSFMWRNIGILAFFSFLFISGTLTYFFFSFKRNFANHSNEESASMTA